MPHSKNMQLVMGHKTKTQQNFNNSKQAQKKNKTNNNSKIPL